MDKFGVVASKRFEAYNCVCVQYTVYLHKIVYLRTG